MEGGGDCVVGTTGVAVAIAGEVVSGWGPVLGNETGIWLGAAGDKVVGLFDTSVGLIGVAVAIAGDEVNDWGLVLGVETGIWLGAAGEKVVGIFDSVGLIGCKVLSAVVLVAGAAVDDAGAGVILPVELVDGFVDGAAGATGLLSEGVLGGTVDSPGEGTLFVEGLGAIVGWDAAAVGPGVTVGTTVGLTVEDGVDGFFVGRRDGTGVPFEGCAVLLKAGVGEMVGIKEGGVGKKVRVGLDVSFLRFPLTPFLPFFGGAAFWAPFFPLGSPLFG